MTDVGEWHREKPFAASGADSDSNDDSSLEKARGSDALAKTATGQAQIGADEEYEGIDKRTFLACLALSFLWTGSQIPLYMLLVCIDYTLADIGGADVQIWYVLGPITALAATAPIAGSISDIFGRRWAILVGGAFTIIGLILIGTTQTVGQNIASFPLTGIGAALLEINALAGVNEVAPNKQRGFYTSVLIWTIIPFAPLGIYALELSVNVTWRWNVWIPLIWVGIGQIMTFIFYKPPPRIFQGHEFTTWEKVQRVDWIGAALSLAAAVLFLFGLGAGGYTAPWKSVTVILPLILGFLLFVALGFWELHARHPLYPPGMFTKAPRVFVLTLVITAIAGANFFSILILWPKFVISVFVPEPAYGGLLVLGQTTGVLFGAGLFSFFITQFRGSIRPQMFLACAMMLAGFGALYCTNHNRGALAAVLVTIGSIGVGGIIIPASVITQLCTPDEYLGTVTAITFVARVIGGAIGFTVYYYVLNKRAEELFLDYLHFRPSLSVVSILLAQGKNVAQITDYIRHLAISDTKYLLSLPRVTPQLIEFTNLAARDVWSTAFQQVWLCTLGFSGVAAICSIFLGDVRKYMTNHRAVHY